MLFCNNIIKSNHESFDFSWPMFFLSSLGPSFHSDTSLQPF